MLTIDRLVNQFGGIRPFARSVGRSVGGVQHWLSAGRVPAWHVAAVRAACQEKGIPLTSDDIVSLAGALEPPEVQAARDAGA